jgi:hypothetical protein
MLTTTALVQCGSMNLRGDDFSDALLCVRAQVVEDEEVIAILKTSIKNKKKSNKAK